jgi:hypothetical protein
MDALWARGEASIRKIQKPSRKKAGQRHHGLSTGSQEGDAPH